MPRAERSCGFTLVELLVVVVIIGILASIALPNFIGAQEKAKTASVRGNMHTTQIASEAYATDSGAIYASAAALLQPYYPGGSSRPGGTPGTYPLNPVTGAVNESPVAAGPVTSANINTLRASAPSFNGVPGRHTYNRVDAGASYSVVGFDARGYTVPGNNGKILVLSNQ
ncbi:MAG: prepilin-type N-terminal cleavage/methylation domain-containing protein [Candidatus Obscuribacterales bacterium]|nr:prepilin-type N-terminal cleavage/methylation domain-containing protein [Candidatus Obscuribacterales bacterium]